jgi:hypothetical protein
MADATNRQKQFLRQLGHKSFDSLSKEGASTLIDELLKAEKASGKTFPCPYCKKQFGPRPRRTKKCPSCNQTIIHLSGKFYTEDMADELNQKEWLNESRKDNRDNVKDDWKEERSFRKEFGEVLTVGYIIKVGPECITSQHLNGLLVTIEDAYDSPDLLPPFDACRHETCECDYEPVSPNEVPKGTKIAEWSDPEKQAKLKTRLTSLVPTGRSPKRSGCAGVLLVAVLFAFVVSLLTNAI